jgi:Zn-dependent protease/CBS domain-containing protein
MGSAIRIGRLFGIEFRIDPSWLFIFVLIAWSLTSLFAAWHPAWSLATSIVVAVTAALVFFASVLFHELAHSVVAMAYGIPVRDITLHLFGGVSNIEKEPPTPAAELLMAIVGPIASIGLGCAMMLASVILIDLRTPDGAPEVVLSRLSPIETLLVWLGPVNVVVGLFNLMPGFPLDGGRVLRALVWKLTGSLDKATRVAGGAGQAVGILFITMGLAMVFGYRIPFFGTGPSGLWLAMIGLFLRNAAAMHVRSARVDRALSHIVSQDLMRTNGGSVEPDMPLGVLIDEWFLRRDELAYPVLDRGTFLGIVTIDDLRKLEANEWDRMRVRDVMTPSGRVVSTTPTESLSEALRKLGFAGVQQLPVLSDNALVGMLYVKDIGRWLQLRSDIVRSPTPRHA